MKCDDDGDGDDDDDGVYRVEGVQLSLVRLHN